MNVTTVDTSSLKGAVGFTMKLSGWGNTRKADIAEVTTSADKKRMRLRKDLIVADEYDAIKSFYGELRQWVAIQTVPSFFREGFQLTSIAAVGELDARMKKAQVELREMVDKLIVVYPAKIEEAKLALNSQFNQRDYPSESELANSYRISWNFISFSTPADLPEELRQQEQDKLAKQMQDAGEQITLALRVGFQELINHAIERLTPGEDGKPKTFRDTLVGNVQEFLDTFQKRNLTNDVELQQLVNKAQEILIGVEPDALRKDVEVRDQFLKQFNDVKAALDPLVEVKKARVFELE